MYWSLQTRRHCSLVTFNSQEGLILLCRHALSLGLPQPPKCLFSFFFSLVIKPLFKSSKEPFFFYCPKLFHVFLIIYGNLFPASSRTVQPVCTRVERGEGILASQVLMLLETSAAIRRPLLHHDMNSTEWMYSSDTLPSTLSK